MIETTTRNIEIIARAIDVLGSPEAVERFLNQPAMALDGMRPVELLSTAEGAELVDQHLKRVDFGVYT